jgi:lipid-A-disaccharide synthase-like uncharacterized protein
MPPERRLADRQSVKLIGWVACIVLSGSLIYVFVRSLIDGPSEVDPVFLTLQTLASSLFLLYSLRVGNRVFVTANGVALLSAVGTLVLFVTR